MGRFLPFKVASAPFDLVQNGIRIFKYDGVVLVVLVEDSPGNEENVILT